MRRKRGERRGESPAGYYDLHGILGELAPGKAEFALEPELRKQILQGERSRKLLNISIKLDPVQIVAVRKIATMKSIPYQTLIRQWLTEGIRRELGISVRRRAY